MYSYEEAVVYFENEVLHNEPWTQADEAKQKRALKNAANELYNHFPSFNETTKPLPSKAIYEQALWLLRKDDSIQKAEMGITNINLSGEFSMSLNGKDIKLSPNVLTIMRKNRRVGRYV